MTKDTINVFFIKKYGINPENLEKLAANFGEVYTVDVLIDCEGINNDWTAFENAKIKLFENELNSMIRDLVDVKIDLDLALALQDGKHHKYGEGLYHQLTLFVDATLPKRIINAMKEIAEKINVDVKDFGEYGKIPGEHL